MQTIRNFRRLIYNARHGWLSVPLFYLMLTALAYVAYSYLSRLGAAQGVPGPGTLWQIKGSLPAAIGQIWYIFAWGFGVQLLVQIVRVVRRQPREAHIGLLLKHGAWMSLNAGIFEELIFRLYAFLSFAILVRLIDVHIGGWVQHAATQAILPVANFLTLGLFQASFSAANWALGLGVIIGGLFFRSAHLHYGRFSKANVWVIGMVMFWLTFNYGLLAAMLAHFLYDLCVFTAIALTSPLQPRSEAELTN